MSENKHTKEFKNFREAVIEGDDLLKALNNEEDSREVNIRQCKICNEYKKRISDGKFPDGRNTRFVGEDGKLVEWQDLSRLPSEEDGNSHEIKKSKMTKADIDKFILDTHELGYRIKRIDNLISNIESKKLKKQYTKEMLELIEDYNLMSRLLETEIKIYLEEERKTGNTESFFYNKVLRSLKN